MFVTYYEAGKSGGKSRRPVSSIVWALLGSAALVCWAGAASAQHGEEAKNTRLVGHNDLQARSAYQPIIQKQGKRWIAYVGHHGGEALNPITGVMEINGVSIVDVTNPRKPEYLHHLPAVDGAQMVQTCSGDVLPEGVPGAWYLLRTNGGDGHEVWDVTDPSAPSLVSVVLTGLNDTHKNWWECETGIAYLVADLTPEGWSVQRALKIFDLSDPANPVFIRNYGLPETLPGAPPSDRSDVDLHEPTVLGNRVYLGYNTSAEGVCQILDRTRLLEGDPNVPESERLADNEAALLYPLISRLDMPDYWGCHTYWAMTDVDIEEFELFGSDIPVENGSPRDFAIAVNESTGNRCQEMHQMVFFVDITQPEFPWVVSNYHVEEDEGFYCDVGGRFGAHSMNWSRTRLFYKKLIAVSYFNAGARIVDVRNPYHPKEVGKYIPATTENTEERCAEIDGVEVCQIAIQTNNVEFDDRGYVYLADRANTGLHIIELTGEAKKIADLPSKKGKRGDDKLASN